MPSASCLRQYLRVGWAFVFLASHAAPGAAAGPCLDLFMLRYDDYVKSGPAASRQRQFSQNTRFVLCVQLGQDAFVAIDDAAPNSSAKRLFPNARSHPGSPKAVKISQGTTCFGADAARSGTGNPFPLTHRREDGTGPGKISVYAASKLQDIPSVSDFAVPGSTFGLQISCQSFMKGYLAYDVVP